MSRPGSTRRLVLGAVLPFSRHSERSRVPLGRGEVEETLVGLRTGPSRTSTWQREIERELVNRFVAVLGDEDHPLELKRTDAVAVVRQLATQHHPCHDRPVLIRRNEGRLLEVLRQPNAVSEVTPAVI